MDATFKAMPTTQYYDFASPVACPTWDRRRTVSRLRHCNPLGPVACRALRCIRCHPSGTAPLKFWSLMSPFVWGRPATILRCLDMRVMDGDLVVPTCLRTPTLILPARCFVQLYYDPDSQGQYTSDFPTRGQGFLQPRGDIRTSIVPRNFRILPDDVREVVDLYFHREGLEAQENQESDDCMSTDTEAANTVRHLQLHCPVAMASLQMAVHEALAPATATRPQPPDCKRKNINTTLMTLSLIYMKNIRAWQNGSCSGRLPIRAPPALHRGGHPISVGPSSPTSTNYLI